MTEELVFRSIICTVSQHVNGFSPLQVIFLTPLYFGFGTPSHWGLHRRGLFTIFFGGAGKMS